MPTHPDGYISREIAQIMRERKLESCLDAALVLKMGACHSAEADPRLLADCEKVARFYVENWTDTITHADRRFDAAVRELLEAALERHAGPPRSDRAMILALISEVPGATIDAFLAFAGRELGWEADGPRNAGSAVDRAIAELGESKAYAVFVSLCEDWRGRDAQ